MKALKAKRSTIAVNNSWESPPLHILLTKEDDVIVARCLDFTVSSHEKNEKEALDSLISVVKEYIFTALENNAINTIYDPAHGKYWRMFNEAEAKQTNTQLKRSLRKSISAILKNSSIKSSADISRA